MIAFPVELSLEIALQRMRFPVFSWFAVMTVRSAVRLWQGGRLACASNMAPGPERWFYEAMDCRGSGCAHRHVIAMFRSFIAVGTQQRLEGPDGDARQDFTKSIAGRFGRLAVLGTPGAFGVCVSGAGPGTAKQRFSRWPAVPAFFRNRAHRDNFCPWLPSPMASYTPCDDHAVCRPGNTLLRRDN
jgi:hypothetical protein